MDKIFYYRHTNNEVYEMKFKKVIVQLDGTIQDISNKKFYVCYVEVEVAGLGTLSWVKYRFNNDLCVYNIYDTIEKAIRGINNNTITYQQTLDGLCAEDVFKVKWGGFAWDCSTFDFEIVLPSHIFCTKTKNFCGQPTLAYKTWVWDGFCAIEKSCIGSSLPNYSIRNSTKVLLYDIINNECFYDKDIVGYATREECVRASSVKIHRF